METAFFSIPVSPENEAKLKSFQNYNPDGGAFEYYYSRKGLHYFRNRNRTIILQSNGKLPFKKGQKYNINPAPTSQPSEFPLSFSTKIEWSDIKP